MMSPKRTQFGIELLVTFEYRDEMRFLDIENANKTTTQKGRIR